MNVRGTLRPITLTLSQSEVRALLGELDTVFGRSEGLSALTAFNQYLEERLFDATRIVSDDADARR